MFENQQSENKPELIIALIGPLGTALNAVTLRLQAALSAYGYMSEPIRVSALIERLWKETIDPLRGFESDHAYHRIENLMNAGDELRRSWKSCIGSKNQGCGEVAALLAIQEIQRKRKEIYSCEISDSAREDDDQIPEFPRQDGRAYILNSLKHPEEINILRKVYGDALFIISVYSPKEKRLNSLVHDIMKSESGYRSVDHRSQGACLIRRDETGDDKKDGLGQDVEGAFPLADAFISETENINNQIQRTIEIIFGHPFRTPTVDEQGMFFANSASLRSADLSRQVGAVIIDKTSDGEVLASGCNEVPRFGGGAPWASADFLDGTKDDYRDYQNRQDSNATTKRGNLEELFRLLRADGWLEEETAKKKDRDLAIEAIGKEGPLKDARVCNVLEYGRPVHAEMFAITQASKNGISIRDSTMYCTTFPCHMCASHIVASGIKQVVYIQPYPKSLVGEQYESLISVAGEDRKSDDFVNFDPFIGVAPRKYQELFEMTQRKDKLGYARVPWEPKVNDYRFGEDFPHSYFDVEDWCNFNFFVSSMSYWRFKPIDRNAVIGWSRCACRVTLGSEQSDIIFDSLERVKIWSKTKMTSITSAFS